MAVRGRVGVRATGATVVVLIFADWRVANVVDDNEDGAIYGEGLKVFVECEVRIIIVIMMIIIIIIVIVIIEYTTLSVRVAHY